MIQRQLITNFKDYLKNFYFKFHPLKFNKFDRYWIKQKKNELNTSSFEYCLFISSRNNYAMLKKIVLKNYKIENLEMFNIDDGSTIEQQELGKKICLENGIFYIQNKSKGLQMALKTLLEFLDQLKKKYKYILYISHDNYPVFNNFFYDFNKLITENKINNKMGCIGFNHLDYKFDKKEILNFKKKNFGIGHLGRAFIAKIKHKEKPNWYKKSSFSNYKFMHPFALEGVADMAFAINVYNLKKYIKLSNNYRLHCWCDDICLQFLKNNIFNICIPYFIFFNPFELKAKFNIPISSVTSAKKKFSNFHSNYEIYKRYWKKTWKWDRGNLPSSKIIDSYYKGTLISKIFYHDLNKGPYKIFKF